MVSPTEKTKPTLFLNLEPPVKQRVGLENELIISWRWEREMGAEVEFFGNRIRVNMIFDGVKSHGGVERRIRVWQWNLKVGLREFSRLWRRL